MEHRKPKKNLHNLHYLDNRVYIRTEGTELLCYPRSLKLNASRSTNSLRFYPLRHNNVTTLLRNKTKRVTGLMPIISSSYQP